MASTPLAVTLAIGATYLLLGACPRAQPSGPPPQRSQLSATPPQKALPSRAVTPKPARAARLAPVQGDPSHASSRVTITQDGSIEQRRSDGSIRRSRPGVCGWTIIASNGRSTQFPCKTNVTKLELPAPSGDTAAWLEAHANSLLEIARSLLGPDADTIGNHLSKNESGLQSVYDRIVIRTILVSELSRAGAAQ